MYDASEVMYEANDQTKFIFDLIAVWIKHVIYHTIKVHKKWAAIIFPFGDHRIKKQLPHIFSSYHFGAAMAILSWMLKAVCALFDRSFKVNERSIVRKASN